MLARTASARRLTTRNGCFGGTRASRSTYENRLPLRPSTPRIAPTAVRRHTTTNERTSPRLFQQSVSAQFFFRSRLLRAARHRPNYLFTFHSPHQSSGLVLGKKKPPLPDSPTGGYRLQKYSSYIGIIDPALIPFILSNLRDSRVDSKNIQDEHVSLTICDLLKIMRATVRTVA